MYARASRYIKYRRKIKYLLFCFIYLYPEYALTKSSFMFVFISSYFDVDCFFPQLRGTVFFYFGFNPFFLLFILLSALQLRNFIGIIHYPMEIISESSLFRKNSKDGTKLLNTKCRLCKRPVKANEHSNKFDNHRQRRKTVNRFFSLCVILIIIII